MPLNFEGEIFGTLDEANGEGCVLYYGGSFNPPHMSHYLFVCALRGYCPQSQIIVAPTYSHAFEKRLIDFDLRLGMLRTVFSGMSHVTVSEVEKTLHLPKSYTFDVVCALRERQAMKQIFICVGADIIETLSAWHRIEELCKVAKFLVFPRAGYAQEGTLSMPYLPDISSTTIRELLSSGKRDVVRGLIPRCILDDVESLYG